MVSLQVEHAAVSISGNNPVLFSDVLAQQAARARLCMFVVLRRSHAAGQLAGTFSSTARSRCICMTSAGLAASPGAHPNAAVPAEPTSLGRLGEISRRMSTGAEIYML